MKLLTIASIAFETLKDTGKDLATVIKILAVVMDALQQAGVIERNTRGLQADSLDDESQILVNTILDNIHAEI